MAQILLPFRAEYFNSLNNKEACKSQDCGRQYFACDALRLARVVQPSSLTSDVTFEWYHLTCFFCKYKPECVGDIDYFESLRWDDQEKIKKEIKKYNSTTETSKNVAMYTEIRDELPKIELNDEALEVKKLQNKRMYECRDKLKNLCWRTLNELSKENGQPFHYDKKNLDRLADAMTFGTTERCPTCKKGHLEFRSGLSGMSYYCTHEDEWSRCGSYFDEPPRRPFVVPNNVIKDEKDIKMKLFWKQYDQVKIEKRIFERNPPSRKQYDQVKIEKQIFERNPLSMSTTFTFDRRHKPKFEKQIFESNPLSMSTTFTFDRRHKPKFTDEDKTRFLSTYDRDAPFLLRAKAQKKNVYRDTEGNIYSACLSLTDLQAGKNSYCKIEVLQFDQMSTKKSYSFHQSWGEIGMSSSTKEECTYYDEHALAIDQFKTVFEKETGNSWPNKRTFKKVPGKKVFMDLFHGQGFADDDETGAEPSLILEKSVQELVKLIFGRNLMKGAAEKPERDLNEMPLGKLTRRQIRLAHEVLKELEDHILEQKNKVDRTTVVALSNKFYTLIPHEFDAVDSSLLLGTVPAIQKKFNLLNSLMDMAIAYSTTDEKSVINSRYKDLNTKLRLIDAGEPVFKILKQCVQKTHADSHDSYTLDILQIFEAERQWEEKRNERFKTLFNKRLLWHGSAITNFAKILSQGLRIHPPVAPRTVRNMFGQGIYFSDMASKAANYCHAYNDFDNTGLLLLCEVTLGHMKHLFEADHTMKNPPRGYNSVKGVGRTEPSPFGTRALYDDVKLASGSGVPTSANSEFLPFTKLLYNEYVVYDAAQVKIKYLLKVKFNYRT